MLQTGIRIFTGAVMAVALGVAAASPYPDRPINVVSPFPPGGSTDVLTRVLADHMSQTLGKPLIIMNRPGGATTIGAGYAARERPDGYTLLMATNSTLVTSRFLFDKLSFDPDAFEPVGLVGHGPFVLLATKKRKFKDINDIVASAKENVDDLSVASQGTGTGSHLIAECFKRAADINLLHVPFKGSSQAMPMVINGDTDLFFDTAGTGMRQADGGTVDVFAVTSKERMSAFPNLPTLAEQGFPGCEITAWWGLVAPQGTPSDAVEKLSVALKKALQDPGVRQKILAMGIEPGDGTPGAIHAQVKSEVPLIGGLVKEANIQMQ